MVSLWGFGVANTVEEIDGRTTSWRCTVVTLMTMGLNGLNNRTWWGAKWGKLSVQRFMFAIATKRSVAKCFDRSWAYFLARFWRFEGYEHGPRTNTRWMTSPHWLFKNLDCSREFLRLRLPLGWQERNWCYKVVVIHGKGPIRQRFPKDHYEEKEWLIQEFQNFLVRQMTLCRNFRLILLTPLLISQIWGFDNSLFWKWNTFQSWCDAYACAVWCSWCTLEWLSYPYALVIARAIKGGERICVTSFYLTTKIPSALLVAVV
jgi:hypothetical protein